MAAPLYSLVLYRGAAESRSMAGITFTHVKGFASVQAALISIHKVYIEQIKDDTQHTDDPTCCVESSSKDTNARFCLYCGRSIVPMIPTVGEMFCEHLANTVGDQLLLEDRFVQAGWDLGIGGIITIDWKNLITIERADEHLDTCQDWDYRRYVEDSMGRHESQEGQVLLDVTSPNEALMEPERVFTIY